MVVGHGFVGCPFDQTDDSVHRVFPEWNGLELAAAEILHDGFADQ